MFSAAPSLSPLLPPALLCPASGVRSALAASSNVRLRSAPDALKPPHALTVGAHSILQHTLTDAACHPPALRPPAACLPHIPSTAALPPVLTACSSLTNATPAAAWLATMESRESWLEPWTARLATGNLGCHLSPCHRTKVRASRHYHHASCAGVSVTSAVAVIELLLWSSLPPPARRKKGRPPVLGVPLLLSCLCCGLQPPNCSAAVAVEAPPLQLPAASSP